MSSPKRQIYDLLDRCVVRIEDQGVFLGSGFFVAPRQVLTCAHVVQGHPTVDVRWNGTTLRADTVRIEPDQAIVASDAKKRGLYPLPDIALCQLTSDVSTAHPAVKLDADLPDPDSRCFVVGFSSGSQDGDSCSMESDGYQNQTSHNGSIQRVLKFRGSVVRDGLSGSPALDATDLVVRGVLKASRNDREVYGGLVVPIGAVRAIAGLEDLLERNRQHHQLNPDWDRALRPPQRRSEDGGHDWPPPPRPFFRQRLLARLIGAIAVRDLAPATFGDVSAAGDRPSRASTAVAIVAPEGMGKSTFVIELARRSESLYPDGALIVDVESIQDAGASARPLANAILREAGADTAEVPDRDEDRVSAAIALLREMRCLLMLDGIAGDGHEALLRRLQREHPTQDLVLAASEGFATRSHDLLRIDLPPLSSTEAEELLRVCLEERRAGELTEADRPAADAALDRASGNPRKIIALAEAIASPADQPREPRAPALSSVALSVKSVSLAWDMDPEATRRQLAGQPSFAVIAPGRGERWRLPADDIDTDPRRRGMAILRGYSTEETIGPANALDVLRIARSSLPETDTDEFAGVVARLATKLVAEKLIDEAQQLLALVPPSAQDRDTESPILSPLYQLGAALSRRRRLAEATAAFVRFSELTNEPVARADALRRLAILSRKRSDLEEAEGQLFASVALLRSLHRDRRVATNLGHDLFELAIIRRRQSRFEEALEFLTEARRSFERANRPRSLPKVERQVARTNIDLGQVGNGTRELRRLHRSTATPSITRWLAGLDLATLDLHHGRLDRSSKAAARTRRWAVETERPALLIDSVQLESDCSLLAERVDQCIERAQEVLQLARPADARWGEAAALTTLGAAHRRSGNLGHARELARRAQELALEIGALRTAGKATLLLLEARFESDDEAADDASLFQQASRLALGSRNPRLIARALRFASVAVAYGSLSTRAVEQLLERVGSPMRSGQVQASSPTLAEVAMAATARAPMWFEEIRARQHLGEHLLLRGETAAGAIEIASAARLVLTTKLPAGRGASARFQRAWLPLLDAASSARPFLDADRFDRGRVEGWFSGSEPVASLLSASEQSQERASELRKGTSGRDGP